MDRPRNKYGAIRTTVEGKSFASKGEAECYLMLKRMERNGDIKDIECQVLSPLIAGITHRTDFRVWSNSFDSTIYIEYKGIEDQRWRDVKKLWKHSGPGILHVYKGSGLKISLFEEILPEHLNGPLTYL